MNDPEPFLLPPIVQDPDSRRRTTRLRELGFSHGCREFRLRREGMIHAMDGGLWLHRHVWQGCPLVHLVSTDRARLVAYGEACGLPIARLQYKPLKDPRTGTRREAWHWDLGGPVYPPVDARLLETTIGGSRDGGTQGGGSPNGGRPNGGTPDGGTPNGDTESGAMEMT
ncbi:MAG: hypothetical protein ACK6DP_13660 [Gemmatimonas sp.]|uniref:hypothetical protein n=1 Tax=Gemmatimonas sp. TaxID=1962908 RepID=UPI00391F91C8|nr:hypothetical protein [Gemmatimonadota bacterium]